MIKAIKKHIAISFLILVVFNTIGSCLLYIGWKAIMSNKIEEIAKTMPLSYLTKISKTYDGNIEQEFDFNGKMYDVISYQICENIIYYFCINDFEEDCIKTFSIIKDDYLSNYISRSKQTSKDIAKKIFKPFKAILEDNSLSTKNSFQIIYAQFFYSILESSIENLTPPPKK